MTSSKSTGSKSKKSTGSKSKKSTASKSKKSTASKSKKSTASKSKKSTASKSKKSTAAKSKKSTASKSKKSTASKSKSKRTASTKRVPSFMSTYILCTITGDGFYKVRIIFSSDRMAKKYARSNWGGLHDLCQQWLDLHYPGETLENDYFDLDDDDITGTPSNDDIIIAPDI